MKTEAGSGDNCRCVPADYFGDYECRSWNKVTVGGSVAVKAPVCDFGPAMPYDFWSSGGGCSIVGLVGNTTNMVCRSYDNKPLTNKKDPKGLYLDDSASGTKIPSPLP